MTRDFWRSAGFHLLERRADGWLAPTPDFLRAYLMRPEVHPIEESCAEERALHARLMEDPAMPVPPERLARFADPDAIENYQTVLALRDLLLSAGSIEGAYLRAARSEHVPIAPPLMDHLVHVILRNALEATDDPMRLRAAELFFRVQDVSTDEGRIMLADEEIVEMRVAASAETGLAQLLASTGTPMRQVTLDVLGAENKALYWERSDRFDTVIDFRFGQEAQDAFARVLEIWLRHLLGVEASVQPVARIRDPDWRWHIGLDREATTILNTLYERGESNPDDEGRLVALFRMQLAERDDIIDRMQGHPVYLALAMTPVRKLRMKPQNLLTNLPLRAPS